jgi:hypothetical protein
MPEGLEPLVDPLGRLAAGHNDDPDQDQADQQGVEILARDKFFKEFTHRYPLSRFYS